MSTQLKDKILSKSLHIGIIGLGYVGLPLLNEFSRVGFKVTGFDISEEKVNRINSGKNYIQDIDADEFCLLHKAGKFRATTDFKELASMDCVIVCVPTPLNRTKDPDLSYIESAAQSVKDYLKRDCLVILESTTYPGTTREVVQPYLSHLGEVGKDYFLAFSPERVDPGNSKFKTKDIPKVVGGITSQCTELAANLYRSIIQDIKMVSSPEIAETAKLLENTFRSINIALVNEFAVICNKLKINTHEVIEAAATKPFGFMKFVPGPGLGGHCIPIDPLYLTWKVKLADFNPRFIELAAEVNSNMPSWVVERVGDILNKSEKSIKGSKILLLGIAYKKDVDDSRESPAIDVAQLLLKKGASLQYSDPWISRAEIAGKIYESKEIDETLLKNQDLVIVMTDHSAFNYKNIVQQSKMVFDTRYACVSLGQKQNIEYL